MSTPTPTLTGAYTCTHHNDRERAACPVCLVASLTAERDQLRAELAAEREKVTMLLSDAYALTKNWHDRAERAEADAAAYLKRAESFRKIGDEAETELAKERTRTKQIATALTDAISTYFGADKLVTAERIEAWQAALKEDAK